MVMSGSGFIISCQVLSNSRVSAVTKLSDSLQASVLLRCRPYGLPVFIGDMTRYVVKAGCRYRALDPTGKDLDILQAISNPSLKISGLTNKMLRQHLSGTCFAAGRTDKNLSAKISRQLRLSTENLLQIAA